MNLIKHCVFFLVMMLSGGLGMVSAQVDNEDQCISNYNEIMDQFGGTFDQGEDSLSDMLAGYQDQGTTRGNLVAYYCDTRFRTQGVDNTIENNIAGQCLDKGSMRFDPRQSFFMYGLCVGFEQASRTRKRNREEQFVDLEYTIDLITQGKDSGQQDVKVNPDITQYIPDDVKKNLLTSRRHIDGEKDACHPNTGMPSCYIGYPTTNILKEVFGALFDLKKAAIDGYDHGEGKNDIRLAIADLSRSLFGQQDTESGICNDPGKTFLSETDSVSNRHQSHCAHPQTRAFVSSMIEGSIQDTKRVNMLLAEEIAAQPCVGLKETLLTCAMSNTPEGVTGRNETNFGGEEKAWRNLIANELFFARMWTEFYGQVLLSAPQLQGAADTNALSELSAISRAEINALDTQMDMIESASDRMIHLLTQYRTMYHQCVTLTAYQEDLHYFRQRLNKMYTPLSQIEYLVSDAQEYRK